MTKATMTMTDHYLEIEGELTFQTVRALWEESKIKLFQLPQVKVDLSKVTHGDSAGLALLIEWQCAAQKHHKTIEFVHLPKQLLNLARLSAVENILNLK